MDGRVHDVLHAVQEQGSRRADVEEPLDSEDLGASCLQKHGQPDAECGPVEWPVDHDRDRSHVVVDVPGVGVERSDLARVLRRREEDVGLDLAEARFEHARGRVEPREALPQRRCRAEIRLRHDEGVGGGGLPQRLLAREPVLRIDGGDDALELVVVLDDGLGEKRVRDRRRVGEPGRLDDDTCERGDLAALAAAQQVTQLVGEVAA